MARPKKTEDDKLEIVDNQNKLQMAMASLRKQFGNDVVQTVSGNNNLDVVFNSTGVLSVDKVLGGGLPEGRIIEFYGPESSGKTSIALQYVSMVQKNGGIAALVDVEHAFDPAWARKIGVDTDTLMIAQPDSGEQALNIVEALIKSGMVDAVILDSVAALVTQKELDGEMGDSTVGAQARLMGQAMRKLTAMISKTKTTAIFINQIREKIGVTYGSNETTAGGRALKFYASMRIEVRKIETLKEADQDVGVKIKMKVVKNKVAPPFRVAEYDIRFECGIDIMKDLLDNAISQGLIEKGGAWYNYQGRKAQGMPALKELFKDPSLEKELRSLLK